MVIYYNAPPVGVDSYLWHIHVYSPPLQLNTIDYVLMYKCTLKPFNSCTKRTLQICMHILSEDLHPSHPLFHFNMHLICSF